MIMLGQHLVTEKPSHFSSQREESQKAEKEKTERRRGAKKDTFTLIEAIAKQIPKFPEA